MWYIPISSSKLYGHLWSLELLLILQTFLNFSLNWITKWPYDIIDSLSFTLKRLQYICKDSYHLSALSYIYLYFRKIYYQELVRQFNVRVLVINTAQKWNFSLRISQVNVTKSAGNCGFGYTYWKKSVMENFIFCAV